MKFAAIDIGSNAIRLLFSNVSEVEGQVHFKKSSLIRVPLRLGDDAFVNKNISEAKIEKLIKTLTAFKLLIDVNEPLAFRACATSAMREANNGAEIIELIKHQTGIQIEIIDGKTEADLVFSNRSDENLENSVPYLYIDVGGGSTELTLLYNNEVIAAKSFNIGTIRILHKQITEHNWNELDKWINTHTKGIKGIVAIGSGGNINKINKLAKKKLVKPLSIDQLVEINAILSRYSIDERVSILGLNPDRADVIVPAAKIYIHIMKTANIQNIIVPQIGVADGIVHQLYNEYINQ